MVAYSMAEWRVIQINDDPLEPRIGWPLNVPVALARGVYEDLTDEELAEHQADIAAEVQRRELS